MRYKVVPMAPVPLDPVSEARRTMLACFCLLPAGRQVMTDIAVDAGSRRIARDQFLGKKYTQDTRHFENDCRRLQARSTTVERFLEAMERQARGEAVPSSSPEVVKEVMSDLFRSMRRLMPRDELLLSLADHILARSPGVSPAFDIVTTTLGRSRRQLAELTGAGEPSAAARQEIAARAQRKSKFGNPLEGLAFADAATTPAPAEEKSAPSDFSLTVRQTLSEMLERKAPAEVAAKERRKAPYPAVPLLNYPAMRTTLLDLTSSLGAKGITTDMELEKELGRRFGTILAHTQTQALLNGDVFTRKNGQPTGQLTPTAVRAAMIAECDSSIFLNAGCAIRPSAGSRELDQLFGPRLLARPVPAAAGAPAY